MRSIAALLTVLAVVALAAAGCGDGGDEGSATREASTPRLAKLTGTVGSPDDPDAYAISLKTADGDDVTTTLPPGEYMLEINDLSTIHNFHLIGPRAAVDIATDVAGTGQKTAIVALYDFESYKYVCDAHPAAMHVTFSVHGPIGKEK
jgi:hypothetical protein